MAAQLGGDAEEAWVSGSLQRVLGKGDEPAFNMNICLDSRGTVLSLPAGLWAVPPSRRKDKHGQICPSSFNSASPLSGTWAGLLP